ncbi:DUF2848 domain-containing protein [Corynebacterium flavescens]
MTGYKLQFELPDGETATVSVKNVFNAGYAGRDQDAVREHIEELAQLGVPAPATTPTMYPVAPYLAQQAESIEVQHGKTSGEAEWALIIDDSGRELLTVACDHTDRDLETYGVAWSKNASPDVLGTKAFPLDQIKGRYDMAVLTAWVGSDRQEIQRGALTELLLPDYWLNVLEERGERNPGTILMSGTIPMAKDVDQFSDKWRVELAIPDLGTATLEYTVERMPEPIG